MACIMYSRPIETIKQIEITTECNLRCRYCPHPKMQREKRHMDMVTFIRTLKWVNKFTELGTQGEVSLTGIGEPLLHPELMSMISMLRDVHKGTILFSTNGILMTDEIATQLQYYGVKVYVSTHRPEKAGPAINMCRRYGILAGHNTAFATSSLDWAGQVEWEVSAPSIECDFLRQGWGVVMVDGRITTCCMDAEGKGVIGHVDGSGQSRNDIEKIPVTKPYELCDSCHMTVPETKAFEQRSASHA